MGSQKPVESILAADIGRAFTHVCLFDTVDGVSRFVARAESPSTLSEPEMDVTIGLRRAVRRLEYIIQRPLLDQDQQVIMPEQPSNAGVDAFLATSSAAPPLQCVIVGLTDDLSLESARRACSTANVLVTHTLSVDTRAGGWSDQVVASLHQTPPDVILLVGGVDGGPVTPLESAARALSIIYGEVQAPRTEGAQAPRSEGAQAPRSEGAQAERRPLIVFAGNQEARGPISEIVSSLFELRVVKNVRPSVYVETPAELQRELSELYERIGLPRLPGYRRLSQWCTSPMISTTRALSNTLQFIARRSAPSNGVLGADVGGSTTFVGSARGQAYQWTVGANLGTSYGISRVVDLSGLDNISRWLPPGMSGEQALANLENARLRPHSIAQSTEDLLLVHAVVRQALLLSMQHMQGAYWVGPDSSPDGATTPAFDLIAARGGAIAHTPHDGMAALSLLDALQPVGLTRLVVDWASLWPQLGAIAAAAPLCAAQILERDAFRYLGTVIAPLGKGRRGTRALHLRIVHDDGEVVEREVSAGAVERFPLGADAYATIEVRPSRNFDIGLGHGGVGGRARVRGGSLGIIVDTRGRPLVIPRDTQRWRASLQRWLRNLNGDVIQAP